MKDSESLEDFYMRKFDMLPENFRTEIGHFNMFRLEPLDEGKPTKIPYKRRDFYKVMLVKGNSQVHYADRIVAVKEQALCFSNPQIPYRWEHLDRIREGIYCIFDQHFFNQFGRFQHYEVFQPQGNHIFELNEKQAGQVSQIYKRMAEEFESDYKYKYDLIRNLIFELLHFALKLEPSAQVEDRARNASQRISTLFMELLERQFPIDETHQTVKLRSASEFAEQLNVHVNHLNRAIKGTTQKTTTEHISGRILQESKSLLKNTDWNVSEIAYALGFTEATHFNNFFKKHLQTSPSQFRSI